MGNSENTSTRQSAPIRVTMLGDLQLSLNGVTVNEEFGRSQKIWNLLAYLIVHRRRNVPQEELIEMLWPDEGSKNPGNALKTLLYRVRFMLTPLAKERGQQLILSRRGAYSWNPNFPCELDVEEFAALIQQAGDCALSAVLRRDLYRRAFSIYQQDFLAKLSGQLWVIPMATHYHNIYVEAALEYARLLLDDAQYIMLADFCAEALRIEPYHEQLHALMVRSLLLQGKNAAALSHYEQATEFLYRHLGLKPCEELRALYRDIMAEQKDVARDLSVIQNDLRESSFRPGAFVCEYGFFREAYRLEARRATRQGSCLHLALLTISPAQGFEPGLGSLNDAMEQLLQTLQQNLRRGDIIARYSGVQYVLMLPSANYEDSLAVMERILRAFSHQYRKPHLTLSYRLTPLDAEPACWPWQGGLLKKNEASR